LTELTVGQLKRFIEDIVGRRESEASSSLNHTNRLESFLWDQCTKEEGFRFKIEGQAVCESTVAFLLGYISMEDGDLGCVGGGWKKAKQRIKDGKENGVDFAQIRSEDLHLATSASGYFLFVVFHTNIYCFFVA